MKKTRQTETILVIVLGLIVIYWFRKTNLLLIGALVVGFSGLLIPGVARGIDWVWTKLSHLLGALSGKLLLTGVYLLVLIPLSFVARRLGKIAMRTKPGGKSYFSERNHTYIKEDMQHPW